MYYMKEGINDRCDEAERTCTIGFEQVGEKGKDVS